MFSAMADAPLILPRAFLKMCRRSWRREKVADSLGATLTGGNLLVRTLILRRLLLRDVLAADEQFVGLLLPPSAPAVVANAAIPLAGRVAVNLNYTLSKSLLNYCIEQCGIRHVLTSRRFVEKLKLEVNAELVYLEDFASKVGWRDKAAAYLQARFMPIAMLERQLGLDRVKGDDVLTVIFTSGSTGNPKGVMLSHANLGSNIDSIEQCVHLGAGDVAVGVLPFFHSYGYLATMWTILALEPKGVYHFNPLDAHEVGKLCREHRATVFMATPTFVRTYLKRCAAEDFRTLDVLFAAAERCAPEMFDAFEKKFGVRPLEAYGCTELSPLVAVGRPIPNVRVKIVRPESVDSGKMEELPPGQSGMLLVAGPNVMKGYLHQPELTARVIRDGWYITGDLASVDADGFITITGRESRFSKLGGEMVPHVLIEEKLQQILGGDDEHLLAAVTAVPDARKGERLVVVHLPMQKTPEQLEKELSAAGLPNLFIPSPDSYIEVHQIPVLGTGKLDLKGVRDIALTQFKKGDGTMGVFK
jgi:acyl-[acyl-carrier-protein]-phospholipid O-acyltransferase/long-chain-fatty-acid--[acyl-carrier-protein] ligase